MIQNTNMIKCTCSIRSEKNIFVIVEFSLVMKMVKTQRKIIPFISVIPITIYYLLEYRFHT